MTPEEAQSLMQEGAGIDAGEAEHAEASLEGRIDARGQVVEPNPDAAAMEWFLVPKMLAWAITTVYPETKDQFDDAKCMELARAIVPVAEKYGVNGMSESPELMLLAGCAMFGTPAYLAYKARQRTEAIRQQGRDQAAGADSAPAWDAQSKAPDGG